MRGEKIAHARRYNGNASITDISLSRLVGIGMKTMATEFYAFQNMP